MSKRKAPRELIWRIGTVVYVCDVHPKPCVFCGKRAIVALPPEIIAQQPDDTTAVCHPALGGCNNGFAANVGHALTKIGAGR